MTMPVEPQGQAPEAEQQPTGGQQAAAEQATPQPSLQTQDVSQLPDWAQKLIADTRAEAARHRTEKKSAAEQASAEQDRLNKVLAALGINADGEEDLPEHARQRISEYEQRAQEAETRALEMAYASTVTRAATAVGADAEALLDSDSFRDAVGEELGEEFDDAELRAAVEKVAKEFAKKPRFARQQGAARSGADFTGSPGAPPNIDQQIAEAEKKRDFGTAIALKRARARAGQ